MLRKWNTCKSEHFVFWNVSYHFFTFFVWYPGGTLKVSCKYCGTIKYIDHLHYHISQRELANLLSRSSTNPEIHFYKTRCQTFDHLLSIINRKCQDPKVQNFVGNQRSLQLKINIINLYWVYKIATYVDHVSLVKPKSLHIYCIIRNLKPWNSSNHLQKISHFIKNSSISVPTPLYKKRDKKYFNGSLNFATCWQTETWFCPWTHSM